MASEERPLFPVVIVGKDRTRMTCAVIDHIKAHLSGVTPYFICVSDKSREGHDAAIRAHLAEIGETTRSTATCTIPEGGRYGWGAAINIGLELAFSGGAYKAALVVDNDWLLQKDLDIPKYLLAFERTVVGAITFKPIHAGTNIEVKERAQVDGAEYLLRSPNSGNTRFSFTAELGCAIITRRLWESSGLFQENCKTDETEWGLCNWYNALSGEEKTDSRIWFATDQALYYTELNGEGHVFTHVGLHSQHDGPQQWECPEEYRYLSDDEADARVCVEALLFDGERGNAEVGEAPDVKIDWGRYFDKVYCMCFLDERQERLPRLRRELARVDLLGSPVFEWRYGVATVLERPIINDAGWPVNVPEYKAYCVQYVRALKESMLLGHKRIMVIEDDIAFLRDKREIVRVLEGMPHAAAIQFDKFVWDKRDLDAIKTANKEHPEYFSLTQGWLTSSTCNVYERRGMEAAIAGMEKHKYCTDHVGKMLGKDLLIANRSLAIQVFYQGSQGLRRTTSADIHKCYRNAGIDSEYRDYSVPDGYVMGMAYEEKDLPPALDGKRRKGRKFISVYAIAKNEESVAERWYKCVKEADEVCVLDTGSTDNTVEILRSLGAKVTVKTYKEWSFAEARNDSMKLVSPDAEILFTLDLDETIAPGWRWRLEDAWISEERGGRNPVGVQYKYIWSWREDGKEAQSFAVQKVHAKGTGRWKYRCHELLTEVSGYSFFLPGFVVEHHQNAQTSRSQYMELLRKDAQEMPEDARSAYYYARELMYDGQWEMSRKEFKRQLALSSAWWKPERAAAMRSIAECCKHLGDEEGEELWLWKSAEEDKTSRDATFSLGRMAMDKKDYRMAVVAFERCLAIKEPSLEYISSPLCWTAIPWFLYSQALWWVGRWDDAINACEKAKELEPNNQQVLDQLHGMRATNERFHPSHPL